MGNCIVSRIKKVQNKQPLFLAKNAKISDASNRQYLSANLLYNFVVGNTYCIVFKYSIDDDVVNSLVFTYEGGTQEISFEIDSNVNMSLTATTNKIICNYYSGSWRDIYIDVFLFR